MKKMFACFFAAFLCLLYLPSDKTYANGGGSFEYKGSFDIGAFLNEFSTGYENRSVLSPAREKEAALFLAGKFSEAGLLTKNKSSALSGEEYLNDFTFMYSGKMYSSANVIGVKPSENGGGGSVIIGAHYDNVYDYVLKNPYTDINYSTLSNGAYDNGSGISVMMSVAYNLKDIKLPFNVIFAAFGAEEMGMFGSKEYVKNMGAKEKEDTLLMINLDSISAGDYLYLFTKDWKLSHDSYLRAAAKELNIPLRNIPFDKKYMSDPFGGRLYSHTGYYSDNYFFLEENINTAFFMSMNWESVKKAGIVESDFTRDIMHTSEDNYQKLAELYPDTYILYMQYISQLITHTLQKENFSAEMIKSRQNAPDYSFIMNQKYLMVTVIVLLFCIAVFAYFYYLKLKKVSDAKIKEYLSDPKNIEKVNIIFKGYGNMPPFGQFRTPPDHTYPPHTYKPKKGEDEFSVFGKEYEKHDDGGDDGKENKDN